LVTLDPVLAIELDELDELGRADVRRMPHDAVRHRRRRLMEVAAPRLASITS